jgi:hypothetical protein
MQLLLTCGEEGLTRTWRFLEVQVEVFSLQEGPELSLEELLGVFIL